VLVLPFSVADAYVYFHILIVSSKASEFRPTRLENKERILLDLKRNEPACATLKLTMNPWGLDLFRPARGHDRLCSAPWVKFTNHLDLAWLQRFLEVV
jgi:hypothetical protein